MKDIKKSQQVQNKREKEKQIVESDDPPLLPEKT